jgi:hypothetical protein
MTDGLTDKEKKRLQKSSEGYHRQNNSFRYICTTRKKQIYRQKHLGRILGEEGERVES